MIRNDWALYVYPLLDEQLTTIGDKIEIAKRTHPNTYSTQPRAKLLAKILDLMQKAIPADPGAPQFRQGNTLGKENRQWFRAKFHARYRIFFRFSTAEKAIVYAWMNDESTLRKSGSKTDPYTVFESMLEAGDPPRDFEDLLARSRALEGATRCGT